MNKMKRFLMVTAVMVFVIPLFGRKVHADLVYTPIADNFYESHAEDLYRRQRFSPDSRTWQEESENLTTPSEKNQWKFTLLAAGILAAVLAGGIGLFFAYIRRGHKKKKRKSK